MQAHIAFSTDGHAEGTVTEHLDTNLLARRTTDMLGLYLSIDLGHLLHVQLAGEHNDIGKLSVEAQRLDVGDVQLCGEMHLLPHPITIGHNGHVGSYHGRDTRLFGSIDDLVHQRDVLTIDDGVHRQVTLDAMLTTGGCHLLTVR